jgi:hypothetical protein
MEVKINDVIGHEIAHVIFNSLYKEMNRNRFIDEGIATFFNEDHTFYQFVKKFKQYIPHLDVLQLWQNTNSSSAGQEYYYFAAAFIGYLLNIYGKQKFLIFIQNEEFENAKKIFGSSLETTIQKFYAEIDSFDI